MQLIEDLLDISRIIRGDLPLSFRLVEPIQVITAAIDAVQPSADTKAFNLSLCWNPRIARFGGTERLQQVVWNLLKCHQVHSCWRRVEVRLEYVDSQVQIAE